MFENCSSLTEIENLPSISCNDSSYRSMFKNCINLKSVYKEIFGGLTLNTNCCRSMFENCSSLLDIPDLPATTLKTDCYNSMFKGCTSLTGISDLPATKLAMR